MKRTIAVLLLLTCILAFIGCKDSSEPSKQPRYAEPNVTEPEVPGPSAPAPDIPKPNDPEPNVPPSTDVPAIPPADTFEITGTVAYKNIEGGFFAIDAEDGRKYDPINLPEQFRKNGLEVKVTARIKPDAVSFHMYGSIIEVVNITAR